MADNPREGRTSETDAPIVVASNRGPFAFRRDDDGSLVPKRAGGGLVACLAPAVAGTGAMWFTAQVEDDERNSGEQLEAGGFTLKTVPLSPAVHRQYYDVIANGTLWLLHHNLLDLSRRPRIDARWWEAWRTYCAVNQQFADSIAADAPANATVLVHDYHLTLIGGLLRDKRPDLNTVHFHHSPFVGKDMADVLPDAALRTLLEGLAGHKACGFNSQRWADNFVACCEEILGYAPRTFVSAATPDVDELREVAASADCRTAKAALETLAGDNKLIVRVDRIELSKNLLRGFLAFDELLHHRPQWREKVVFAAFVYPSREGLVEYLAYRNEVQGLVDQINAKWATAGWTPIVLHTSDNFPQSLAALTHYDVLLVNPVRDGLNLVAKEGAVVNERAGAVVLSRRAGSFEDLADAVVGINPFDIEETSNALHEALSMSDEDRASRAAALFRAATQRTPEGWLSDQLREASAAQ